VDYDDTSMTKVTDGEFEEMVARAVQTIPARFAEHLNNVAFMTADMPTAGQLTRGGVMHHGVTLLGLYEGIPLPKRSGGYNGALPDVVTVFKIPHEQAAHDRASLERMVHETVWHEVAHYFGLDHGQIHDLQH
jgi:predicted Zn-dependent protease with MMP-like domain